MSTANKIALAAVVVSALAVLVSLLQLWLNHRKGRGRKEADRERTKEEQLRNMVADFYAEQRRSGIHIPTPDEIDKYGLERVEPANGSRELDLATLAERTKWRNILFYSICVLAISLFWLLL